MRKKTIVTIIFLLVGISMFLILHPSSKENEIKQFEKMLTDLECKIDQWEDKARLIIVLTIIVGSLGVIIGVLQTCRGKWSKRATIAAGIIVSLITIVCNTLFDVDHRTLLSRAEKGQQLILDIRFELTKSYNENNREERKEWLNKIHTKLTEISELSTINIAKVNESFTFSLPGVLYAMDDDSQKPSWLNKMPEDKDYLFFLGFAENSSLKKAKEFSYLNAIKEAVNFFERQLSKMQKGEPSIDIEALSEFLTNSAKTSDTFYSKHAVGEEYNYYTLVRINKNVISTDLRFYEIKENVSLSTRMKMSFDKIKQSSETYFSKRLSTYNYFCDQAKEKLKEEDYTAFTKARVLRKQGKEDEAIVILEQMVEANPEFYFGWHNLALAYDAGGQSQKAKLSYEKAVQLEPKQTVRDASVYNSFGYFLYQQKEYNAAIEQFNKALKIEPNHPKAKKNVEAAKKALKESK